MATELSPEAASFIEEYAKAKKKKGKTYFTLGTRVSVRNLLITRGM